MTLRIFTHISNSAGASIFQQSPLLNRRVARMVPCWSNRKNYSGTKSYNNNGICKPFPLLRTHLYAVPNLLSHRRFISYKQNPDRTGKTESKSSAAVTNDQIFGESSKLSLFQKFKLMYKNYWYVLIPVHVVTSIVWFGGFYYLSTSGVDIPSVLHQIHVSDTIIEKIKNSSMGHLAIAYLCYKIATPLRYAVTVGGTTVSIKYLVQYGYIQPVPSKQELMNMYDKKKSESTKEDPK